MKSVISLLVLVSAAACGGPIEYFVEYIRPPAGFTSAAFQGVNDAGQVAGTASNGVTSQAVIGHPSGTTLIPLPPGWASSTGAAINASGQVAGTVGVGSGGDFQAFIGDASGSTLIPIPLGWRRTSGEAINASGQVAGTGVMADGHTRAFVGDTSGSTEIPPPPGIIDVFTFGMNASGQVTGWTATGIILPFIGDTSGSTMLPVPADWTFSAFAYAINDAGFVAVRGHDSTFVWNIWLGNTSGGTLILPPVGLVLSTRSLGLNNHGVVVATGVEADGANLGFMWDSANGTRLLSDLVPSEWNILRGISISDNGKILAYGTGPQGEGYLLLTPLAVPEPGTFALIGCGLAACFWNRRRVRSTESGSSTSSARPARGTAGPSRGSSYPRTSLRRSRSGRWCPKGSPGFCPTPGSISTNTIP